MLSPYSSNIWSLFVTQFVLCYNINHNNYSFLRCDSAVPENIHTLPTEGIGISWRVGGSVRLKKCKEMYEA